MREEDRRAAYHEAAHVVIARLFGWEVDGVSICSHGGGSAAFLHSRQQKTERAAVCVAFAGPMAEVILGISTPTHRRQMNIRFSQFERFGRMNGDDMDEALECIRDRQPDARMGDITRRLHEYEAETLVLLREPQTWAAVEALAEELAEKRRLSADEVAAVLGNHPAVKLPTQIVI